MDTVLYLSVSMCAGFDTNYMSFVMLIFPQLIKFLHFFGQWPPSFSSTKQKRHSITNLDSEYQRKASKHLGQLSLQALLGAWLYLWQYQSIILSATLINQNISLNIWWIVVALWTCMNGPQTMNLPTIPLPPLWGWHLWLWSEMSLQQLEG